MRSILGRHLFALALIFSALLHAVAGVFGHSSFEPPRLKPVRSGIASISLRSSVSAGPKPAADLTITQKVVPPEKKAPPRSQLDPLEAQPEAKIARAPEHVTPPAVEKTPAPPKEQNVVSNPSKQVPQMIADKVSLPSRGAAGSEGAATDAKARALAVNRPPRYPAEMLQERPVGSIDVVELSVLVDAQGRAERVRIARSSGFDPFDQSAVDAARQWVFEPARRNGTAVPAEIRVPIEFERR